MCKPTRSTLTITVKDDQGHEYSVSEPLAFHWAKRLQPTAEKVLQGLVLEATDILISKCEAEHIEEDLFGLGR